MHWTPLSRLPLITLSTLQSLETGLCWAGIVVHASCTESERATYCSIFALVLDFSFTFCSDHCLRPHLLPIMLTSICPRAAAAAAQCVTRDPVEEEGRGEWGYQCRECTINKLNDIVYEWAACESAESPQSPQTILCHSPPKWKKSFTFASGNSINLRHSSKSTEL